MTRSAFLGTLYLVGININTDIDINICYSIHIDSSRPRPSNSEIRWKLSEVRVDYSSHGSNVRASSIHTGFAARSIAGGPYTG
jgi:hypothetical protein